MNNNTTFSIGNKVLIDKVDAEFNFFEHLFKDVSGVAKNTVASTKLLIYNRLGDCLAVDRIPKIYPVELFENFGFKKKPSSRSINREVERLGKISPFLLEKYQDFIQKNNLVANKQFIDFSSSYFEGKAEAFGEFGYSRDGQSGKKQLTFGIATGINSIPSALTVQKGNVQDKKHFSFMLKTANAVLDKNSLLIFDCGGNTKENKKEIRAKELHYLTLKQKKRGPYLEFLKHFQNRTKQTVEINNIKYECVKYAQQEETSYIFFSEKLKQEQLALKERKFKKQLEKNKILLEKTKKGKPLAEYLSEEGTIIAKGTLQAVLEQPIQNKYITLLEGYFILESSIDTNPEYILALYKDKDKAEKLIRDIKEGTELRPMRHWSKWAILGYIILIFLTNFLTNLTLLRTPNSRVNNVKLLKKYLNNLTLTIVYPQTGFKFSVLANISQEIQTLFGDFLTNYEDKSLPLRW